MAYETTLASAIITRARQAADAETNTPTVDHTTDVELLAVLNEAWRELLDLIMDQGDACVELLMKQATLTSPFTLPADFYRIMAVDAPSPSDATRPVTLQQFNFRARNQYFKDAWPHYRVEAGALVLTPSRQTPTSVTVWYVGWPTPLASSDPVTSFNGWHTFIISRLARYICVKEDRDTTQHDTDWAAARVRVEAACKRINLADTQTMAVVEFSPEAYFDRFWFVG